MSKKAAGHKVLDVLLLVAACCTPSWLYAQGAFPSRPLKIVVPTTAGGNLDLVARLMAERLAGPLGQNVLVENRVGASSSIGTRYVGQSAPDGHTILMMGNTFASTPFIMTGAGYDPIKDFVGVTMITRLPELLIVPLNSPYRTLADMIAAARANPGKVTYASAGAGSVARFASERLAFQLGLKLVHVPYKGNGEAITDMIAGRVDTMFDQISTSMPHVKAGKLRALAVTSARRSDALPEVPTFAEAGVRNFEDYTWIGFVVPAATPRDALTRLHAETVKVLQQPDVRARFLSQGQEVLPSPKPEDFTAYIREEVLRLAALAKEANIRLE
jgi:tripartite-type tricarboxylate transporter receptor subunit TctC